MRPPFSVSWRGCVVLCAVALCAAPRPGRAAVAADAQPGLERAQAPILDDYDRGSELADQLSQSTGVMLSPLLGLTAVGAYHWYTASPSQRARLPWHDRPIAFLPAIAIMLFLFFGHRLPVVKHAFKQLKVLENKVSGLVALPLVAASMAHVLAQPIAGAVAAVFDALLPVAYAGTPAAPSALSSSAESVLGGAAAVVLGAAVWLVGHTVNVLAAMSPFSLIDHVLKAVRLAAILFLLGCAKLSPGLGAAVAATYILFALLVAGWSFRLTVFGWVVSTDVFLLRRVGVSAHDEVVAFSARGLEGVPARTYGVLQLAEDGLRFRYRAWLLGPRREVALPPGPRVLVRGMLSPTLLARVPVERTLFRLPPRYRPAAAAVAIAWRVPVEEAPLRRGVGAAVAWIRAQLGLGGGVAANG